MSKNLKPPGKAQKGKRPPSAKGRPASGKGMRPDSARKSRQNLHAQGSFNGDWKPANHLSLAFNSSFIAAEHVIARIEEKVNEHYQDIRINQIAVPDSSKYALQVGHHISHQQKIQKDLRKDDFILQNDLKNCTDEPIMPYPTCGIKYHQNGMEFDDAEEPGVPIPDRSAQVWFDRNYKVKEQELMSTKMSVTTKSKVAMKRRPSRKTSQTSAALMGLKRSSRQLDGKPMTSAALMGLKISNRQLYGEPMSPASPNRRPKLVVDRAQEESRPGTTSHLSGAQRNITIQSPQIFARNKSQFYEQTDQTQVNPDTEDSNQTIPGNNSSSRAGNSNAGAAGLKSIKTRSRQTNGVVELVAEPQDLKINDWINKLHKDDSLTADQLEWTRELYFKREFQKSCSTTRTKKKQIVDMENYTNQENSAFANELMRKGQVTTNYEGKSIGRKAPNTDNMRALVRDDLGKNVDHNPKREKMSMYTRFAIAICKKIRRILTDGKEERAMAGPNAAAARLGSTRPGKRLLDMNSALNSFDSTIEDLAMEIDTQIRPHDLVKYTNVDTGKQVVAGKRRSITKRSSVMSTKESQKRGIDSSSFSDSDTSSIDQVQDLNGLNISVQHSSNKGRIISQQIQNQSAYGGARTVANSAFKNYDSKYNESQNRRQSLTIQFKDASSYPTSQIGSKMIYAEDSIRSALGGTQASIMTGGGHVIQKKCVEKMFGTDNPKTNLLKEMGMTELQIRNKNAQMCFTIDLPSPGRRTGQGEQLGAEKSGRIIVGKRRNVKKLMAGVPGYSRRGVSELRTTSEVDKSKIAPTSPHIKARAGLNVSALSTISARGSPVKGIVFGSPGKSTYQSSRPEPMKNLISANGSLRNPTMATKYLHSQNQAGGAKMKTLEAFYDGPIQTFEVRSGRSQGRTSSLITSGAAENALFQRGKAGTTDLDALMVPEARETFFNRRTIKSVGVGTRKRAAFLGQVKQEVHRIGPSAPSPFTTLQVTQRRNNRSQLSCL